MPYHDDQYPGQPLWQSVVLFCGKGMIEVIMVLLFFWLLIQVLFTKQIEGHLQVLLISGLVVFCLCLVLGCFLCWTMKDDVHPVKEPAASPPVDPATPALSPPLSASAGAGHVPEFPSAFSSLAPSSSDVDDNAGAFRASEFKELPKSYFPLRRLSSPTVLSSSPLYRSMASLPSLPRLGLLSKVLERRRAAAETDGSSYSERSRLTPAGRDEAIPLGSLHYGSSSRQPGPGLDFTMAFSPEQGALTVQVLGLTRASHGLDEVSVLGSLAPLCPCPVQASSAPCGPLSLEPCGPLGLVLRVGSIEELQRCVLRLAVYACEPPSQRGSPLGEVEVQCGERDWRPEQPLRVTEELSPNKWKLKKDAPGPGLSCMPQAVGQLFILLQYQTLAHRIKAMVLRADNLGGLIHTPHTPDYQMVIVLRHEGAVIGTTETTGVGGTNTVWNSPCHFDLPPGDISQLPLMLEFIVIQNQVDSKSPILGRVLIGAEAAEAGRAHWRDMCSQGQVERARWHAVQPEPL